MLRKVFSWFKVDDITKPVSTDQNLLVDQNLHINQNLLVDTLLSTMIKKDVVASTAHSFLEANSEVEACQKMLENWESLEPSSKKVIALASMVKLLQKEKDILLNNLSKAENEVQVFSEAYNQLYKMNMELMELVEKERQLNDSGGKNNKASLKNNKQNFSPRDCSSIEKTLEFIESGSSRQDQSSSRHNTRKSRTKKK